MDGREGRAKESDADGDGKIRCTPRCTTRVDSSSSDEPGQKRTRDIAARDLPSRQGEDCAQFPRQWMTEGLGKEQGRERKKKRRIKRRTHVGRRRMGRRLTAQRRKLTKTRADVMGSAASPVGTEKRATSIKFAEKDLKEGRAGGQRRPLTSPCRSVARDGHKTLPVPLFFFFSSFPCSLLHRFLQRKRMDYRLVGGHSMQPFCP